MEPVGIQGLLPLMPSIPSVVPVAIPESGGDPPESTLTELVPVRTAKQTTAAECLHSGEASQEGSSSTKTEERTAPEPMAEPKMPLQQTIRSGAAMEAMSPDGTPYVVPPHLMGRSLENPSGDPVNTGRRPQKPRLGVRVPHRNLTSQIVSQNELAQELLERSMKKLPLTPDEFRLAKSSGYPFFTQKLAERLSKTLAPAASKMDTSTLRTPPVPLKVGNTPSVPLKVGNTPPVPLKVGNSPSAPLKVGSTPSAPLKKPTHSETPRLSPGFTHIEKPSAGGDAELLSILEGDGDPLWLPDKLVKKEAVASLPTVPNLPRSNLPPPIVLDPILERELALKQLEELPVREHKRKSKGEKTEEPKKKRVYKRKRDQMDSSVDESTVVNGEEGAAAPAPTNRKRKMSPDVAAVLKKPPAKVKKTVKAVPNGKAPKGVPKKTPKVVLKKKGAKATKAPVANGTAATAASTKGAKRGRRSKKDEPEEPEKVEKKATPAPKRKSQTPAKSVKQTTPPASAAKKKSEPKQEVGSAEQLEDEEKSTVEIDLPGGQGEEDMPNVSTAESVPQEVAKPEQPSGPSRVSELDRLLGDEGAVNLLFDVDGSTSSGAPSRRSVPSKDLALRARLVKTAVLRLSQTSQGHVPLALRARRSLAVNAPPRLSRMGGEPRRQSSVDSRDAPRSPPSLTPMDVSPNHRGAKYVDHSRMKLSADASRIIRRHSSSSTFSSPSVSPRRVSVDLEHPDGDKERADGTAMTPGARKKGVPIFVRDKETTYSGKKKSRMVNPAAVDSTALSLSESARKLLELQVKDMKVKKTLVPNPAALKKKDLKKISSQVKNKVKSEMFKNFKKGLDGAVVIAAKKAVATKLKRGVVVEALKKADDMEVDNCPGSRQSTPPPSTSKVNQTVKKEGDKSGIPLSPDASSDITFFYSSPGYSNLIKTLKHDQKSRRVVEDRQRASMRHCAGTYTYRELTVRRYDKVVHIIMAPVSTKIRSGVNVQVLRELRDALHQVKKDDSCRVVLLTSAGASFCQGIDVSCLLHNNVDKRKAAAIDMIVALKDFLKCLASFPKPVIAGVHGPTVGLGVTMLPLFDMVFASDKATFLTPYARLGQVPEGAATLTLPYMLGYTLTSELLLGSREMTAAEALNCGLVTRTLWPDRFLEELVPLVKSFASQSAQSMEATKALLRHGLRTKFDAALESESHLLVTHWTSNECQDALRRWLESGSVALQRPRLPDA